MKTKHIIIVIILIIVGIILFLLPSRKDQYFNKIEMPNDNFIGNTTEMKFMDTIVLIGLDELDIKGVYVVISPLTDEVKTKFEKETNLEMNAHIVGEGYRYLIFIRNMGRIDGLVTMSHELIHMKQYYEKRLRILNSREAMFNDSIYNISDFDYMNRPWEKEAYDGQYVLKNNISKKLYSPKN